MKNEMNTDILLISNGYLQVPTGTRAATENTEAMLGTVLANLAHHGFVPNIECMTQLRLLSAAQLKAWWPNVELAIKSVSGASRQMGKFVVYKNFPKECLAMGDAEWVIKQILMYIGFPNELFTEEEKARPSMLEAKNLKVLSLASATAYADIFKSLMDNASRWSDNQELWAKFLIPETGSINVDEFKFKENGIVLAAHVLNLHFDYQPQAKTSRRVKQVAVQAVQKPLATTVSIANATDVLRLCAAMSGCDASLRETVRFRRFKRAERRLLVTMLEGTKNLTDDFAMRPESWKRLLAQLHPGDYSVPRVKDAYNALYKGEALSFNAKVDPQEPTEAILDTLVTRPGEFLRRFHHMYDMFGLKAAEQFVTVIPKLSTGQLVKFRAYIETINERITLMYAPKGNWGKVQVAYNEKKKIRDNAKKLLVRAIGRELKSRWKVAFPNGIKLDPATAGIKLQSNDQKLAEYGRGTVFNIPDTVNFLRSASYWKSQSAGYGNIWFDNGWNFFDQNWADMGVCSWDNQRFYTDTENVKRYGRRYGGNEIGAIFSGDPTNSKEMAGRACQMADLYIDKLVKAGVRYAVWNVLCFSKVPFNDAEDVLATLQMGEDAESGKLYEPSRAQMVFPLKGKAYTKYVAYIDLVERKLVYMDADLKSNTTSASYNGAVLTEKMPAYQEYLDSLPSVADLFGNANKGTTPVVYTDEGLKIRSKKAYVFQPRNPNNSFEKIALSSVL